MKLINGMTSRFVTKPKRLTVFYLIPVFYVISTIFYAITLLKTSRDINFAAGTNVQDKSQTTLIKYFYNYRLQNLDVNRNTNEKHLIAASLIQFSSKVNNVTQKHYISWINKPDWVNIRGANNYISGHCPYSNCEMIDSHHNLKNMGALIFDTKENLPNLSRSFIYERPSNQVWVFFQMEPPSRIKVDWFRDKTFQNSFNWSWSYKFQADIFRPIRTLSRRNSEINRDYAGIFNKKTKMVAWVVSHCYTQSKRERFVSQLVNEGIQVDIFGICSSEKSRETSKYILKKISEEYKFYLAFENSFCEDYITEKFFTYYGLDVVLIVRGGLNYSHFFDKSTFVDTKDFASVKQLANFILKLNKSEQSYTSLLRKKDMFVPALTQEQTIHQSCCQLCTKLNNAKAFHNIYFNLEDFISNNTCYESHDYN